MPTIRINHIDIGYDTFGSGHQTLLLLHGGLLSRRQWQQQVYPFSSRFQVITCDLRGHGQSGKSEGAYAMPLFADDVSKLIAALGLEQVVVCGHSFGGMVAQELALMYPDQVSALILAETSYGASAGFGETLSALMGWWALALTSVERRAQISAERHGRYNPDAAQYLLMEINYHARDKANYLNILRASISFNSKPRLQYLECPTLLLVGEFHPQSRKPAQAMERLIKRAHLVTVQGAGYLLNWDTPDVFNRVVLEFMERWGSR